MTADFDRWTPGRKAEVCIQIAKGDLAMTDAMAEHGLSFDELQSWLARWTQFGEAGLSVSKCQTLRPEGFRLAGEILGPIVAEAATKVRPCPSPEPQSPAGRSTRRAGADSQDPKA